MTKDRRLKTDKHMAAAKTVGLILLGKARTKGKNHKHYQFEKCNHVQDIGSRNSTAKEKDLLFREQYHQKLNFVFINLL